MDIKAFADEIITCLGRVDGVKGVNLRGSLASGKYDQYSDIDLTVDVTGLDNGDFAKSLPALLANIIPKKFSVVYTDFAPSLAPEKYVVTAAFDSCTNEDISPFWFADIEFAANPHRGTISKDELRQLCSFYDHTLKLFTINLKHSLRKNSCGGNILKMYSGIFPLSEKKNTGEMLKDSYEWLCKNALNRHAKYLNSLKKYIRQLN